MINSKNLWENFFTFKREYWVKEFFKISKFLFAELKYATYLLK